MAFLLDTPGLWFGLAMLLPLATFLVVLVGSVIAALARRYDWERIESVVSGRPVAILTGLAATGVIGLSFVLSVAGFLQYEMEYRDNQAAIADARAMLSELAPQREKLETEIERLTDARTRAQEENNQAEVGRLSELLKKPRLQLEEILGYEQRIGNLESFWQDTRAKRWSGTLTTLVQLNPTPSDNPSRGTVLRFGFAIDSLTGLMFVMITFIALLIHVYSLAYMSDELPATSEESDTFPSHRSRGRFSRFYLYLALFSTAMLHLVLAEDGG